MTAITATVALLLIGAPVPPEKTDEPFRTVAIPARENGYDQFKSQVIASQKGFDEFVKEVKAQEGWNKRDAFLDALGKAKVDFKTEALVLIRQTEPSGGNEVKFSADKGKEGKVACLINRKVADFGTADLASYCFALAVKKGPVKQVEVRVDAPKGEPRERLVIPAR